MTQLVEPTPGRKIIPLAEVFQVLNRTKSTLQRMHLQPGELTVVGIDSEQVSEIELLVARRPGIQQRLDATDLREETQAEREAANAILERMRPLANALTSGKATSEEVCRKLFKEGHPLKARAMLHALATSSSYVSEGSKLLQTPTLEATSTKLHAKGNALHGIKAMVSSVDRPNRTAELKLTGVTTASPLFTPLDFNVRTVNLHPTDEKCIWLLTNAMLYGLEVKLSVLIDVTIEARRLSYSASLQKVEDEALLKMEFRSRFAAEMGDLYSH